MVELGKFIIKPSATWLFDWDNNDCISTYKINPLIKSLTRMDIDDLEITVRHASERSQEINKQVQAKRILIMDHRNEIINHIGGMTDSSSIMKILLLRHKIEDTQLRARSKKDWSKLLAKQGRELKDHSKAIILPSMDAS